jgi:TonB-dependent Receptor Plug Domain
MVPAPRRGFGGLARSGVLARCGLALVPLLLGFASGGACQVVGGRIVDALSGRGIPFAEVSLVDTAGSVLGRVAADSLGRFSLTAAHSRDVWVYGEAMGYWAMTGMAELEAGRRIDVVLALQPKGVELKPLDVTVPRRDPGLARTGFYERQALGEGHLLDRKTLMARGNAQQVSDWMRGIPGVSVDNLGHLRLRGVSSMTGVCSYRVFLDGLLVVTKPYGEDAEWVRELVRPDDVEGIEVYARPSEVPIQYSGAQGACGVILIWTRR